MEKKRMEVIEVRKGTQDRFIAEILVQGFSLEQVDRMIRDFVRRTDSVFGCNGDENRPHSFADLNVKTGEIPCENCGEKM